MSFEKKTSIMRTRETIQVQLTTLRSSSSSDEHTLSLGVCSELAVSPALPHIFNQAGLFYKHQESWV